MSKLIEVKQELIHGHMCIVRVYAQDKSIDNLSLTRPYFARLKGYSGGLYKARDRGLKLTKEVKHV